MDENQSNALERAEAAEARVAELETMLRELATAAHEADDYTLGAYSDLHDLAAKRLKWLDPEQYGPVDETYERVLVSDDCGTRVDDAGLCEHGHLAHGVHWEDISG